MRYRTRTGAAAATNVPGISTGTIENVTGAEHGDDDQRPVDGHGDKGPLRARTALLVVGLIAVAGGIPLAVALGVLRSPHWYPLLDLAQTELRVRDVGGRHSPLVGLAGRITGDNGLQGSHPGPLSFWMLAPFYTLFGRTAWALQAAAASLNLLAMGLAVWIAHRRGGVAGALGATLALGLLMRAYAGDWMTEAWNPYMPMMWWVVFLLAVWSVLVDDLVLLPVAVVAGTFCAQTHIPYLGLVVGVGGFTVAWLALRTWRQRKDADTAAARSRLLRWALPCLGLLALLWLPPVIDQAINDPGNLTLIEQNFTRDEDPQTHAPYEFVGFREAAEAYMGNLDPTKLFEDHQDSKATAEGKLLNWPAITMLAVWAGAVVVAWRKRYRDLLTLHAILGVALALGLFSISRIFDLLWYYLLLWSWGLKVLILLATAWTFVRVLSEREDLAERRRQLQLAGTAGLAVSVLLVSGWFTVKAAETERPAASESDTLAAVTPAVMEKLDSGDVPGGGKDGRYLVEWWGYDSLAIGSQGFGFLLELERQGFDVGVPENMGTGAVRHRVRQPGWATARLIYAVGESRIEKVRDEGGIELVSYEPRTPAEIKRFDRLYDEAVDELQAEGHDDLVEMLGNNLLQTGIQPSTPPDVARKIGQLMDLGMPTSVFVVPTSVG